MEETIFHLTKLPLTRWSLAIYLIIQSRNGISQFELARQVRSSPNIGAKLCHKLAQVMLERNMDKPLPHKVEIDDVYCDEKKKGMQRAKKRIISILKRSMFICVFIFQICIRNHLYSMPPDEESPLTTQYTRKILKTLASPFKCCFKGCKGNSHNKIICYPDVQYQAINNQDYFPIKQLSKDTLGVIAKFLTPLELVTLKMTCWHFYTQINDDFWKIYNVSCNYQSWSESIPLMQVSFTNFLYNNREVEKSADLGFPDAKKEMKLRESTKKQKEEDTPRSRPFKPFFLRIIDYTL